MHEEGACQLKYCNKYLLENAWGAGNVNLKYCDILLQ
jgi:hypothetical protein